jgi:hypothetical protein
MIDLRKVLTLVATHTRQADSQEASIARILQGNAATTNLYERDCVDTAQKLIDSGVTAESNFSFTEVNYQLEVRKLERIIDAQFKKNDQLEKDMRERTAKACELYEKNEALRKDASKWQQESKGLETKLIEVTKLLNLKETELNRLSNRLADVSDQLEKKIDELVDEKSAAISIALARETTKTVELRETVEYLASALQKHTPQRISCPCCNGRGEYKKKYPSYITDLIGIEMIVCEHCRGTGHLDNPEHAKLKKYLEK